MAKKYVTVALAALMMNLSVLASTPLSRGTALSVRIVSQVTSKEEGSPSAIVENDVKSADGKVLIKRGTPVQLQIDRQKARGCGKPGSVAVKCVSTNAVDGQNIMLEGSVSDEGNDKKGLSIGLDVGLGLTFLPGVGFAFLAIKGEQAVVESNTIIPTVFVMNDYSIE